MGSPDPPDEVNNRQIVEPGSFIVPGSRASLEQILNLFSSLDSQGGIQFFPGDTVADLNPTQIGGLNQLRAFGSTVPQAEIAGRDLVTRTLQGSFSTRRRTPTYRGNLTLVTRS